MAVWDQFLTERDKRHLEANAKTLGGRRRVGFGKSPALLLVDNSKSALGDERLPLEESIKKYPASMGLEGWAAVDQQERLLMVARQMGLLVIHTNFDKGVHSPLDFYEAVRLTPSKRNSRQDLVKRNFVNDPSVNDFTPSLAPADDEIVLLKTGASAFLGTSLLSILHQFQIDTLLVGGNSTSGCVRATVCDGGCHCFRMIVVEECVYDRTEAAHAMSLFDMDQKYGDVRGIAEVMDWLQDPQSDLRIPSKYEPANSVSG